MAQPAPPHTNKDAREFGFFLNGEWVSSGTLQEIRSPFNGEAVARVHLAGVTEAEKAIEGAARAFAVTRKLPAFKRQRVLREVSAAIAERREEFARMISLEAGKPIKAARAEVERAVLTFSVAAEEATRIYGELLPLDSHETMAGRWGLVRRFPVGPIAGITPFNFPLNLVAHKVAPAIAAGCPIVLKPAPQTPATALMLAEVVQATGYPAGALQVLPMNNEDAAALVTDERLKLLSFTGSAPVGWSLKGKAGKKKVVLELGGNAGVIVHRDADVAFAAERCVVGGYTYAGQSCISVQRIYAHKDVYEQLCGAVVARVKKLRSGDPLDESVDVGPLIRESDAVRAQSWIEEAVGGGAQVLVGGKRNGSMLEPTVLTRTRSDMKVICEEIFAPVVTIEPYADFGEALRLVNDSKYGLQAGLFTRDHAIIQGAFEELEVGGVMVGDVPTFRADPMPYGGVKDSGLGREGLRYAIEEMTEPKILVYRA